MNPNLMEQFLGPSTQFFRFNTNEINVVATPTDKKTCLLTKRNVITGTSSNNSLNTTLCKLKTRYTKYSSTKLQNLQPVSLDPTPIDDQTDKLNTTIDIIDQDTTAEQDIQDESMCKSSVWSKLRNFQNEF